MKHTVLLGSRWFRVVHDAAPAERAEGLDLRDRESALAWLRRVAAVPTNMPVLRDLLAEDGALPGMYRSDDHAVLAQLAARLATGRVRVVPRAEPAVSLQGGQADSEPPPSPVRPAPESRPVLTWLTIELVGEDDMPVPGERYRVELPDGSVREGSLDRDGLARLANLDPGQCVVTFPALDADAWSSLGTTGER